MKIIKETSPHLHRKDSLVRMLGDVLIALLPVIVFSYVSYTWLALRNFAISLAVCILAEFVYVLIKNRIPYDGNKHSVKEQFLAGVKKYRVSNLLSSSITAIIFALVMPVAMDPGWLIYIALVFGALFGIVIGKLVFGGTGSNIFNPAAVGMVFAKLCFGSHYLYPTTWFIDTGSAVSAGGTPLGSLAENSYAGVNSFIGQYADLSHAPVFDLMLGRVPGVMGEAFKFAILLGLVYLLIRRAADFRVVASYLGIYVVLMAIAGAFICTALPNTNFLTFMLFQLFSGGVLFGVTYMLTDPVTMPINSPGRVMYGLIAGSITVIIRLFGAFPEGVVFSILIANMLAPVIDYPNWASQKYSLRKMLWMAGIVLVSVLVVILGLVLAK